MKVDGMNTVDLGGASVLIVEDEFYLAMDIKQEIEKAGGSVRGPYGDAVGGLLELRHSRPDCAIVDINLGDGPSYEIAEELKQRRIPFVFLTGYDSPAIPAGLKEIQRIEKPARLKDVVEAVGKLTGS